ncbi:MAG: hypothetical protein Fur0018_27450 [Anaerolineales bacterium]
MAKSKKSPRASSQRQHRSVRSQQIVMSIFGVLIILSMVLALVAK